MRLTFNEKTKAFGLYVPRGHELTPDVLVNEYGLDHSSASDAGQNVYMTREPYAAVSFYEYGTFEAQVELVDMQHEIERSMAPTSDRHIEVPHGKELWPFQKADIDYMLSRDNSLVGDQPGLGKTQIAIAYCNERQARRNLVICPASIRLQWANRVREWSTLHSYSTRPYVHVIHSGRHGVASKADYTIASFELARNPDIARALASYDWDTLIIDEIHYLKELDALRSQSIYGSEGELFADWMLDHENVDIARLMRHRIPLMEVAANIVGLSGTPMPNRPAEAYSVLRHLAPQAINHMSHDRFRKRFNPPARLGVNQYSGAVYVAQEEQVGRQAELQNRMRVNLMTRHLKREVMPQLQMPVYDLIMVDETSAVKEALKAESLLHLDGTVDEFADIMIDPSNGGLWATARRMMGEAIAPQAARYIDMLIEGGEDKLVVFGWHNNVMDYLEKKLAKHGVLKITGTTSAIRKDRYVTLFQTDPQYKIILGNLLSLGTGTDGLQRVCNHGLIVEPSPVPGENVQCFDRLDRGGQKYQVFGEIFVAPGSILEVILGKALGKMQVLHSTLDKRVE